MTAHRTDRWQRLSFTSKALADNALGDPYERPLWVWSPADSSRRYPSIYLLQGMGGMVDAWFNVSAWTASFPDVVDRLEPDAVVVLVDAFTSVGGSQFLDSPGTGRYHTYLCDEIVPFVDATFPTLPEARHRGIQGKSSGGYGAMVTPMLRPDLFGGLATHAGDAVFELCYQNEFAPAARALREKYEGSFAEFWRDFRSGRPVFSDKDDYVLINTYAMAAVYSANEDGTIALPFDVSTGELTSEVFDRWLAWDPVRMARGNPRHAEALRGLRAVWIDSGRSDEHYLDLGATAFRHAIREIGVPDDVVHFELFDGKHSGINWRYPLALAWLVDRLA
jgi:S-formylglutathione hydrolase FrmB